MNVGVLIPSILGLMLAGATGVRLRKASLGFTTVDVPGAFSTGVEGVNRTGQSVGFYLDFGGVEHGFLLTEGAFIAIDVPGARNTSCHGINSQGDIVGSYDLDGVTPHGFLLTGGRFIAVDVPGAASTAVGGIKDAGQMVGTFFDIGGRQHGLKLDQGRFLLIDTPGATHQPHWHQPHWRDRRVLLRLRVADPRRAAGQWDLQHHRACRCRLERGSRHQLPRRHSRELRPGRRCRSRIPLQQREIHGSGRSRRHAH